MYISSQSFELQDGILDNSTVNIEDDSVKRQWTGASILGKRNRNERCPSLKNPLPRKIRNPSSLRSTESPPVHAFRLPTPPFVHRPLEYSQDVEQLTTFISYQRLDRSPPAKYRRRVATPKRPRPARAYTDPIAPQITAIQVLLTPCHICHKAPRLKKDLEALDVGVGRYAGGAVSKMGKRGMCTVLIV
ncbi:hypothetical protein EJ08DRAFT_691727 [Tothia fuscella]|uniref:Uncharacterized protein n=1 Tax=Tothia fuscella TaxID=1048955 RepID=A0A9P4U4E0_9PEZI|nr:hypothetical protein EJ08DRAFT_691727 [Tothia fuscella]